MCGPIPRRRTPLAAYSEEHRCLLIAHNDLVLIEVLTLPVYGSVVSHAQSNRPLRQSPCLLWAPLGFFTQGNSDPPRLTCQKVSHLFNRGTECAMLNQDYRGCKIRDLTRVCLTVFRLQSNVPPRS